MSGMVSKDVIDQIRNALDISDVIGSYIQIKRAGNSAKALCPFHKEKTPSFHVNPARQAFHCFGCGAGGDVFKFVMLYENVDFPTALRMLASQGTAFTEEHARLLKRYADHVIVVLDADSAGQKAALRSAELLIAEGLAVSLAALPQGEDPDSLILKKGPGAFDAVLKDAKTPMGFLLGLLQEREDLRSQEGLLRATRAALDLASHAQGAVQTEQMLREAASGLGVGYDALRRDLRAAVRQKMRPSPPPEAAAPAAGRPMARPVDEVELATLLGTHGDPELAGLVRRWIPYSLISDPACRAVLQALAEEEGDLMGALDDESEECKALAAQIVNAPQKVVGTEKDMGVAKAAQDLIASIWRRHLEARKSELEFRKQKLEGEEHRRVLREYVQLVLDLEKLKRGWAQAHPIIDLHLQRLAEE